jgi:hypothetical protein
MQGFGQPVVGDIGARESFVTVGEYHARSPEPDEAADFLSRTGFGVGGARKTISGARAPVVPCEVPCEMPSALHLRFCTRRQRSGSAAGRRRRTHPAAVGCCVCIVVAP